MESLEISCEILTSPIGYDDSLEKSRTTPVVHPKLCQSSDHFNKNNARADGKYRPMKEEQGFYEKAAEIEFDDITRYFFAFFFSYMIQKL